MSTRVVRPLLTFARPCGEGACSRGDGIDSLRCVSLGPSGASPLTTGLHPPSWGYQRGFTLLEMLAALTVLALCCAVLLTAFGQSAKSLQQVQRSDRLSLAGLSLMDELSNGPLQSGRSSGSWGSDLRWQLDVSQQPSNTPQIALYRLDLNLDEGRRHARFSTLQARAASSGAAP